MYTYAFICVRNLYIMVTSWWLPFSPATTVPRHVGPDDQQRAARPAAWILVSSLANFSIRWKYCVKFPDLVWAPTDEFVTLHMYFAAGHGKNMRCMFSFSSQNLHLVSPIQPLLIIIILFLEAIALCEINHNQIFNHPLGCARVYYAGVVPGWARHLHAL
jgi:hypothetical protein